MKSVDGIVSMALKELRSDKPMYKKVIKKLNGCLLNDPDNTSILKTLSVVYHQIKDNHSQLGIDRRLYLLDNSDSLTLRSYGSCLANLFLDTYNLKFYAELQRLMHNTRGHNVFSDQEFRSFENCLEIVLTLSHDIKWGRA